MGTAGRKLIVLFCMHRSGSSLTANVLEKLGMSLGPFDLVGAKPSNPHGHFESVPFNELNIRIMNWAFGFYGDVPGDPETLARFLDPDKAWPVDRSIPPEWLDEGERVARGLIESGPISGFKSPRTVLTWPFWREVLQRIDDVEIAPVMLVRSPHEIAMSLCSRSKGSFPYWSALDVAGVHFARMRAIADEFPESPPVARFATSHYWNDMKGVADRYGLAWDEEAAGSVYDQSSVHQLPAVVAHPAQERFDELCGGDRPAFDPKVNLARLAEDARRIEALMHHQLLDAKGQLKTALERLRRFEKVLSVVDPLLVVGANGKRRAKRILTTLRGGDGTRSV